jgi:hypothetical protein
VHFDGWDGCGRDLVEAKIERMLAEQTDIEADDK